MTELISCWSCEREYLPADTEIWCAECGSLVNPPPPELTYAPEIIYLQMAPDIPLSDQEPTWCTDQVADRYDPATFSPGDTVVDVEYRLAPVQEWESGGGEPAGEDDRLRDALVAIRDMLLKKPVGEWATSEAIRIARDALGKP